MLQFTDYFQYIIFDREYRHYTFAHGRRPNFPSISDGAPRLIIYILIYSMDSATQL